jgi:two-component system nitrogen regulation sensor histidine kinase GlnL
LRGHFPPGRLCTILVQPAVYKMQQPSSTYFGEGNSGGRQHGTRQPLTSGRIMPAITPERTLDNLTTAVLVTDTHRRLHFINPAGEMLLQLGSSKALGHTLEELLPHNEHLNDVLQQAIEKNASFTARGLELMLPAGQSITVDCAVSPLGDEAGSAQLLLELKQVDRLLRLARDERVLRTQIANRAILAGLAHEIKNPLGGLRGAAQLLAGELGESSLKEYTAIIVEEADRLRALVDRMMTPSRPLARESVNLHQILERVCSLIEAENPRTIRIEREYDPSLPNLMADPGQLTQAVLNILCNAVEAVRREGCIGLRTGVERQFTIGHKRHRLVLRADIEDDGPGIPAELLDSIFYPMVTSKAEGTGLGLAIAQDIIDKHGGLIECMSHPGQTVFSIYMPLGNADD